MKVYILFGKEMPGSSNNHWYVREVFLEKENAEKEKSRILSFGPNCIKIEEYEVEHDN